jgi:hypothetical protein
MAQSAPVLSINCGGAAFTGADGTNWSADQNYSGGDLLYTSSAINNTADLALYRSARQGLYDDFSYTMPVPNGSYTLRLSFAESRYTAKGQRVFNVNVNGAPVLSNFDVLGEVAAYTALDKHVPISVSNGMLRIDVVGVVGRGMLSGIQLTPGTQTTTSTNPPPPSQPPLVSINSGGAEMTAMDGTSWSGDRYFSGGDLLYTGSRIDGTEDLALYRTARYGGYGDFSYTIPIANGSYVLRLRFAEIAYSAKGQRVFTVKVNGSAVLTNFDILQEVPPLTVDDKQLPVSVNNGSLTIDFIGITGRGLINGIQIFPGTTTTATTASPVLSVSPTSLSFSGTTGGGNPPAQSVMVSNTGGGTLSWSAASNQAWLALSPQSGSGAATLSVNANMAGLAAGNYSGQITVTAGASGSPQVVNVSLSVAAAPVAPSLSVSPSSLTFSGTAGGGNPPAQSIAISNSGGGTLSWTASKTQSWLALSGTSGTGAATISVQPATGTLAAGTYTDVVTINAPNASPSSRTVSVTFTVGAAPAQQTGTPLVSINSGGNAFTATNGTNWSADQYYSGGDLVYSGYTIAGTQDLALYRSARRGLYDDFSYTVPVPNGTYTLTLKFAELVYGSRGQRVFHVLANGTALLSNFDILAEVPALTALDKQFPVTVSNGSLRIDVKGVVGFGLLNGIQLTAASSPPPPPSPALSVSPASLTFSATSGNSNPPAQTIDISNTGGGTLSWSAAKSQSWLALSATGGSGAAVVSVQPNVSGLAAGTYTDTITVNAPGANPSSATVGVTFAVGAASGPAQQQTTSPPSIANINAGGTAFTGTDGTSWSADQYYSGGDLVYSSSMISGTQDLALYRSARRGLYGDFSYSIPLTNGAYTLKLRFAELVYSARGQRVFHVLVNGAAVLSNFDILAEVPSLTALDKQFPVTVGNGTLLIEVKGVVGFGILNGIQVSPSSGGTTTAPAPAPTTSTGGNSNNTEQWTANTNPPQTFNPSGGPVLYNGIQLPVSWPPLDTPTQEYRKAPYLVNPPAVVPIDVGRQLFVDDFLIAQTNLTRVQHQPVFYSGNPVIAPGSQGFDNNNLALTYSDGAWYDPGDHLYKMWYDGGNGNSLCYAYSTDGLSWVKPRIADAAVANTNIVLELGGGRDSVTVWMDLHDDPSRKFKLFAYFDDNGASYLGIYFSPDGIHWGARQSYTPLSLSDRTTVFYNPFRNVWVESARQIVTLPATSLRASRSSRSRFYSESRDLQNWNPPNPRDAFWATAEDRDPGYPGANEPPQLYNLDATPYESLMVGLFSWYYPFDGPELVELGVGFSRDGFHWSRPTRGGGAGNALIPATNQSGTWNGFNTQSTGGGFLVVGDQLYFYFSGRDTRHSAENVNTRRSTGLATLRRDGFYSMDASSGGGTLTTRPVRFSGSRLFVNVADSGGQLQVEVLDANGNVIPSFARANSAVLSVDSTQREVTWNGAALGSLTGQTVQFRFYLTNGALYSFWVTNSATGASHGYVAAGGPGFTGEIDQ